MTVRQIHLKKFFIYKYKTSTLALFIKPCVILITSMKHPKIGQKSLRSIRLYGQSGIDHSIESNYYFLGTCPLMLCLIACCGLLLIAGSLVENEIRSRCSYRCSISLYLSERERVGCVWTSVRFQLKQAATYIC